MRDCWLRGDGLTGDLLAEDAVIENPFAPPGRPARIEGRDTYIAYAEPRRADFPVRFDDVRVTALHETADPGTIVVEYVMSGTVTTTGHKSEAAFIGVLRARDGKIVLWREYQNVPAIAAALAAP